ncbi:MAG: hypothetical protein H7844_14405 [Nitrospirae bacterium YQR-1]
MTKEQRIKVAFILNNVKAVDIARSEGVDRSAIYHVIAGRSTSLRLQQAIASAARIPYNELFPLKTDILADSLGFWEG